MNCVFAGPPQATAAKHLPSLSFSRYSVVKEQRFQSERFHAIRETGVKPISPHRGRKTLVWQPGDLCLVGKAKGERVTRRSQRTVQEVQDKPSKVLKSSVTKLLLFW
jgi:hypothetical protein